MQKNVLRIKNWFLFLIVSIITWPSHALKNEIFKVCSKKIAIKKYFSKL